MNSKEPVKEIKDSVGRLCESVTLPIEDVSVENCDKLISCIVEVPSNVTDKLHVIQNLISFIFCDTNNLMRAMYGESEENYIEYDRIDPKYFGMDRTLESFIDSLVFIENRLSILVMKSNQKS